MKTLKTSNEIYGRANTFSLEFFVFGKISSEFNTQSVYIVFIGGQGDHSDSSLFVFIGF